MPEDAKHRPAITPSTAPASPKAAAPPKPPAQPKAPEGPSLSDLPKSPGKPIGATTIPKPSSVYVNKPSPQPQAETVAAWGDQARPAARDTTLAEELRWMEHNAASGHPGTYRAPKPSESERELLSDILLEIQLLRDDMNTHADKPVPAAPRPVTAGMIAVGVFGGILVWTIFALVIGFGVSAMIEASRRGQSPF